MKTLLIVISFFATGALSAQDWQVSYGQAVESARAGNKHLLVVFAGSDWCAPCIKLDKKVWRSDVFRNHAREHYVLYKADFPRRKKNKLPEAIGNQNKMLAEEYNTQGHFPLVVLLDAEGKVLGRTGYRKGTPANYVEHLKSFVH